jgi:uncharacterized membrane protein
VFDAETLRLEHGYLTVEQREGVRVRRCDFDTAWLRVEIDGGTDHLVKLAWRKRSVLVGCHLTAPQRERLTAELRGAVRAGW